MPLLLRELTASDEQAFLDGARAWDGEDIKWHAFDWNPGEDYFAMLKKLADNRVGINVAPKVPSTMFYGFVGDVIIGRLQVRHTLNEALRARGGHIGYGVAPAFRGNGYATEMLKQSLPYCRSLGLTEVMLSCADDNVASQKTIEANGGILRDKVADTEDGTLIRRYWIKL